MIIGKNKESENQSRLRCEVFSAEIRVRKKKRLSVSVFPYLVQNLLQNLFIGTLIM